MGRMLLTSWHSSQKQQLIESLSLVTCCLLNQNCINHSYHSRMPQSHTIRTPQHCHTPTLSLHAISKVRRPAGYDELKRSSLPAASNGTVTIEQPPPFWKEATLGIASGLGGHCTAESV